MKRFFAWFFGRREETDSWLGILCWWEIRRIPYNLILGIFAMLSFFLLGTCLRWVGLLQYGDILEPIALVLSPLSLNIAYTGGWVCEIVLRLLWRKMPPNAGPILFRVVFALSVLVVAGLLATSLVPAGHVPIASTDELVPIAALEYGAGHPLRYKCHCLTDDYGLFINWEDNTPPEIYLYQKEPPAIIFTTSAEELLSWLSALPEEAKIDWIKSCDATRGGMPQTTSDRIQEIVQERRLHLADEEDGNFIICVCESLNTRKFKNLNEARGWMKEHPEAAYWIAGRRAAIGD